MDPASSRLGAIEHEILEALRRAGEPVREAVLYERVRDRGVAIAPEQFIGVAERLAILGHIRMVPEHDLPSHDQAPFEARYYRILK